MSRRIADGARPYMQPGEHVLVALVASGPEGRHGLALTQRRLLTLRIGRLAGRVKEVEGELAIDDIEGIQVDGRTLVILTADGVTTLTAAAGGPELAQAFEDVRSVRN